MYVIVSMSFQDREKRLHHCVSSTLFMSSGIVLASRGTPWPVVECRFISHSWSALLISKPLVSLMPATYKPDTTESAHVTSHVNLIINMDSNKVRRHKSPMPGRERILRCGLIRKWSTSSQMLFVACLPHTRHNRQHQERKKRNKRNKHPSLLTSQTTWYLLWRLSYLSLEPHRWTRTKQSIIPNQA